MYELGLSKDVVNTFQDEFALPVILLLFENQIVFLWQVQEQSNVLSVVRNFLLQSRMVQRSLCFCNIQQELSSV